MLHTTLKLCKAKDACVTGFKTLKRSLGKGHSDTDLIPLTHIIESNGLREALWALRATVEPSEYLAREFAIFCARQVLHFFEDKYPEDSRVRDCIGAVERYNNKEITLEELWVFKDAAAEAAGAAYNADEAAWSAGTTAEVAAEFAAEVASRYTSWAASRAASRTASWSVRTTWAAATWFDGIEADVASRLEQKLKLTELLNKHKEN
jgi:hypothetical protein